MKHIIEIIPCITVEMKSVLFFQNSTYINWILILCSVIPGFTTQALDCMRSLHVFTHFQLALISIKVFQKLLHSVFWGKWFYCGLACCFDMFASFVK